jgi:hypothetical protein
VIDELGEFTLGDGDRAVRTRAASAGEPPRVAGGFGQALPAFNGELAGRVGGGGGPPDFTQGGRSNVNALDDALDDAPDIFRCVLNA